MSGNAAGLELTIRIETQAVRVKRDHESGKWMINQYRVSVLRIRCNY